MSVIIYGPQGCGKTRNAQALAQHFGLTNIIDPWCPGDELPDDTLALTGVEVDGALSFDDAMAAMQSASASA